MIIFRVATGQSWVNNAEATTRLSSLVFQRHTLRTLGELESNLADPCPDDEVSQKDLEPAHLPNVLNLHTTEK